MGEHRGRVKAISISAEKGMPKSNVPTARLVEQHGIEGDAHAGPWHRQVSLLAMESIANIQAKGAEVGPGSFAENITTEGIDLRPLRVGDRLRVGGALLEITAARCWRSPNSARCATTAAPSSNK